MENKFYETGAEFGKTSHVPKLRNNELTADPASRKEQTGNLQRISWSNPEASKQLIQQLLQLVNSKEEYVRLQCDLEELEELFPSSSSLVEKRCCKNCRQ